MTSQGAIAKKSNPRFKFISDTLAELKKVVWLSRREVLYLTTIVVIVTVIMGAFLGLIDYGFSKFINGLFLNR
ncbi:MAG: preprotein translocase subunit SecE [Dehalococcoidales bacterium]|nr:preprotein translocase subunit SecE [Dehalococcoidales bacterium]